MPYAQRCLEGGSDTELIAPGW